VELEEEAYLAHYGVLRKSGRYPWGTGDTQNQRNRDFLGSVAELKRQGMSDTEIAKGWDITTTELRAAKSIAKNEQKQADIGRAQTLKDKGYSNVAIATSMGINESSVRALLAPGQKEKADMQTVTANMLKSQVDKGSYIDVGAGVEFHVGVSETMLKTAVARAKEEGYEVIKVQVPQLGMSGSNKTIVKVLAPPGTTYRDVVSNKDKIALPNAHSTDMGRSYNTTQPPLSIKSKRVGVRYLEEGGADADGVIYVRPGVDDISLGSSRYAQVRIAVDGTHYLKGMAMYKDDLPAGVDLLFNTNKKSTGNKLDAMKELKKTKEGDVDQENPFGATIKPGGQRLDPKTKKVTSVMNIVNEEGDWDSWSRNLSPQTLSKQSPVLAKSQLDMTYERKKAAFDEIMALTNPAVRRNLLKSFAEDVDASAVHLKAASLPKSSWHVILPFKSMRETEIYAPNHENGSRVALIRYPHGGTFEIPELTVNNKNPAARKALGNAKDAVGIHHSVAARLSGADFDGDAVLVIPNNRGTIKTSSPLAGLKNFDPQAKYPGYEGMPKMTPRTKGIQMGYVSNLITDMTIHNANTTELAAAVRHSMVVIDAEKHNLDYKRSAIDNGIANLMEKYQGRKQGGASTLISRAGAPIRVDERKPRAASRGGAIDKATGKKVFEETGETFVDKKGKTVSRKILSTRLAETDDARTLISKASAPIEKVYAAHSNKLKGLADQARKAMVHTPPTSYSPPAKKAYAPQVTSLDAKLKIALRNAPLERQAQLLANDAVSKRQRDNPQMESADLKKIKGQELTKARARTGASKQRIEINNDEWAAIQAGAVSNHKLDQILNNSDPDRVKELATPRAQTLMTSSKTQRAKAMLASGYTQAEVATALGVSLSTLKTTV
jgi:DNA-binding CsgD family transcriptional regulator